MGSPENQLSPDFPGLFFFFLFGGKEGNAFMHHNALRRRVWDSSAGCRWANVPRIPHDYPLKTPYAGITSHIPLREIDRRTCQGSNGKVLPVGPLGQRAQPFSPVLG